jgi:hypothetical protein
MLAEAYRLVPAPTIALLEGRALEQMGRWLEASESYRKAEQTPLDSESPKAFQDAARDARQHLARLTPKIPSLVIEIVGAATPGSASVSVDDRQLSPAELGPRIPVNPGDHVVVLNLDGQVKVRDHVRVAPGESKKVVLDLTATERPIPVREEPVAVAPAPRDRTLGWLALGIGVGATGFGVVSGVMMLKSKDSLDSVCDPLCPASSQDELDRFRTLRVLSSVGYITGAVGIGLGAVLLLTGSNEPERGSARTVRPFARGDLVGVEGKF